MHHPMISTSWYSCLCVIPSQEWARFDLLQPTDYGKGGVEATPVMYFI